MNPREPPSTAGEPIIWLLVVAFIVYGSLYPFRFHGPDGSVGTFAHLLTTWRHWDHPSDLLANILLYIPFGFFGSRSLPRLLAAPARLVLVLAGGVLLSTSMELAQFYDAGRDSTLGDVYANAIGTAIGIGLSGIPGLLQRWTAPGRLMTDEPAALVLAAWFGYRLYPYVPTISPHKYAQALGSVAFDPWPSVPDLVRFAAAWLLVAAIVETLAGRTSWLLALAGAEFLGRILIIDNQLSLKDVAGAIIAYGVWRALCQRFRCRLWIAAAVLAAAIVMERLLPFEFAAAPLRHFGLIPFESFMQGSIAVAMQAFWEKTFSYGGLIWVIWRAGLPLAGATAGTVLLLAATSCAQMWLPDRSSEITDALMAIGLGSTFGLLGARQGWVSGHPGAESPVRPGAFDVIAGPRRGHLHQWLCGDRRPGRDGS